MRAFSVETTHFTAVSKKGSNRVCLEGRSTDSYAKNSKKTASGTRVMAVLFIFWNRKSRKARGDCGTFIQRDGSLELNYAYESVDLPSKQTRFDPFFETAVK